MIHQFCELQDERVLLLSNYEWYFMLSNHCIGATPGWPKGPLRYSPAKLSDFKF